MAANFSGQHVTTQLTYSESDVFRQILTPHLRELCGHFEKNNYEIRIAGGAVRDIILGKVPHDIDFATTATPDQMKEMFTVANVRMINANGESHGTITARIGDADLSSRNESDFAENFEITTLRIDRVHDGRRALVEYTKDWRQDAERRDLTINSMFLGLSRHEFGVLFDYFQGYPDLLAGNVRFVGAPQQRIQEDYLRILRYFRFHTKVHGKTVNHHNNYTANNNNMSITKNEEEEEDEQAISQLFTDRVLSEATANAAYATHYKHDPDVLATIRDCAPIGLGQISGERCWMELSKIFDALSTSTLIVMDLHCNLMPYFGLPSFNDANNNNNNTTTTNNNDGDPAAECCGDVVTPSNTHCQRVYLEINRFAKQLRHCESRLASEMISDGCEAPHKIADISKLFIERRHLVFLAQLFQTNEQLEIALKRLKFSREVHIHLWFFVEHRDWLERNAGRISPFSSTSTSSFYSSNNSGTQECLAAFQEFYLMFKPTAKSMTLRKMFELLSLALCCYARFDVLPAWLSWQPQQFPINGRALQDANWPVEKKQFGLVLDLLRKAWKSSGFSASQTDLLFDDALKESILTHIQDFKRS